MEVSTHDAECDVKPRAHDLVQLIVPVHQVVPYEIVAPVQVAALGLFLIGGRITEGVLGKLGLTDCSMAKKIAETLVGTGVDTSLDGIVSGLTGQKFDFWDSLAALGRPAAGDA